ncbi:N-myristoyltransferase [Cotonvirus japonicus]|uniref:glycylpeptide N-tetradecanoyltransferase n=1 Tax=Cotonvirus japonicus TaxID=2811091 RepID=A0ABM7NTE2_9VIRU|nr:N-myristoyltransferase [Cotonvirus japonicus]BCS83442.1 N-myristoyltransferase [Cotonvirus japonicus]
MSFWSKQPLKTLQNLDNFNSSKIEIIETNTTIFQQMLPSGFNFKTLTTKHLDEIHDLITNHYIEDENHIVKILYSRDFIYWYIKYIPNNFIIGLTYNDKLVGVVTALFIDMIIYNEKLKIPYINFLCVQKKIRKLGLAIFLLNELKKRLSEIGIKYSLFTTMKNIPEHFTVSEEFVVPINYSKLKNIGFLPETEQKNITNVSSNPLSLMIESDIPSVTLKLNESWKNLQIKPFLTDISTRHFLLPKKNIVYTFVVRNGSIITDMVSVYKTYIYSIDKKQIISTAQLGFYYCKTMSLTQLITYLIDKLKKYNFDQLIFKNAHQGLDINIDKFTTYGNLYYYLYNVTVPKTEVSKICMFPF